MSRRTERLVSAVVFVVGLLALNVAFGVRW